MRLWSPCWKWPAAVTVNVATSDSTATADSDYAAVNKSVQIAGSWSVVAAAFASVPQRSGGPGAASSGGVSVRHLWRRGPLLTWAALLVQACGDHKPATDCEERLPVKTAPYLPSTRPRPV